MTNREFGRLQRRVRVFGVDSLTADERDSYEKGQKILEKMLPLRVRERIIQQVKTQAATATRAAAPPDGSRSGRNSRPRASSGKRRASGQSPAASSRSSGPRREPDGGDDNPPHDALACACGCGSPRPPNSPYHDDRHRNRAKKRRQRARARVAEKSLDDAFINEVEQFFVVELEGVLA
jgi:hypothetical protein